MYRIVKIQHSDAGPEWIEQIIKLKSYAWNFDNEKQLEWIHRNISLNDIHVILTREEEALAYLNLVKINLEINQSQISGYGIGNVCSSLRGRGYGKKLMSLTDKFIRSENKVGLLFCRQPLVPFYLACGWISVDKERLELGFDCNNIEVMVWNYLDEIFSLKYVDKLF